MRIGILTFHRSYNYGAFMQCYSLSKRLKQDFPQAEIEVIDYLAPGAMQTSRQIVERAPKKLRKQLQARNAAFEQCIPMIPLSRKNYQFMDCDDFLREVEHDYDLLIVGSDAVFNWNGKGLPNAYFLYDSKIRISRASYAASSYGMDYTKTTPEQREYLCKALSTFSYLGVRDCATEALPAYMGADVVPRHNCDPTCFLDMDNLPVDAEAIRVKLEKRGVDFSRPLIGLMANEHIGREIKRRFSNRAQIIGLYYPNSHADVFLYDLTPFEWAYVFRFFSVTVTHFFHGTYLSLKNLTPVIDVELVNAYNQKYDSKILDLLKRLDLTESYFRWERSTWSFTKRAAYKTHLYFDRIFWDPVLERMELCMGNPSKGKIQIGLQREQEYYRDFRDFLQKEVDSHTNYR